MYNKFYEYFIKMHLSYISNSLKKKKQLRINYMCIKCKQLFKYIKNMEQVQLKPDSYVISLILN